MLTNRDEFIGDVIISTGAAGSFLTALLYSIFTKWGWFKYTWINIKWIINIFGIVFGAFWLSPWLKEMLAISRDKGLDALSDPVYLNKQTLLLAWGSFLFAMIIFAAFISVLKPWSKKKTKPDDFQ